MCNQGWHEDFEDEPSVEERFPDDEAPEELPDDEPDQFRDDVEADADALASAGFGTDEDYGHYGDDPFDLGGES